MRHLLASIVLGKKIQLNGVPEANTLNDSDTELLNLK